MTVLQRYRVSSLVVVPAPAGRWCEARDVEALEEAHEEVVGRLLADAEATIARLRAELLEREEEHTGPGHAVLHTNAGGRFLPVVCARCLHSASWWDQRDASRFCDGQCPVCCGCAEVKPQNT